MPQPEYNLRPLWDGILEIYKAIDELCERHGLTYYVTGGNCLGAVRHKGFIPWDDDFDIFLPWDDYDKFWEYAKAELPEYWAKVTWRDTPDYYDHFGKIVEKRPDVIDRILRESRLPGIRSQGIFVDVFPLVNRPDSLFGRIWWDLEGFVLRAKQTYMVNAGRHHTFASKIGAFFGLLLWWAYPSLKTRKDVLVFHDKRSRRYPSSVRGTCGWYSSASADLTVPIPTVFFGVPVRLPFDSLTVPVPRDYKGYLACKFGDYMKLPPVEKRLPSHLMAKE